MTLAVFPGTLPQTPLWVSGVLQAVVFLRETFGNTGGAPIFSLDGTRAGYISLKTLIDRGSGGLPGLPGVKIAAT